LRGVSGGGGDTLLWLFWPERLASDTGGGERSSDAAGDGGPLGCGAATNASASSTTACVVWAMQISAQH
jgi:hypothetical protein